ncbi:MAG TPA: ABC transporter ATP-binding protein, partial [Thermoanaerobaculia bacterium]|nr:ABC transporter ATP-binding protein [Thermoanaerobaculia bacterium]
PMQETAVRADALTKHYQIYRRPIDRLVEMFTRRTRHSTFSALEDISFDVDKGETVGIVGQNGAGKSTLLKLLCGVTQPTSGTLSTNGTIASILELGTGFHPEFSGRENAALNAAILGLSASEVKARLPAILEFSELGSFLDRPVKTYSSGMYMRLAFSVAVNVNPDILVIDEALAVGDGHFQKKCVDKIREFQEDRRTILFCSHSLYLISSICRRTLWLDHGRAMRYGPSLDVVHDYETFLLERDKEHAADQEAVERVRTPARFREITVCGRDGLPRDRFDRGEDIHVRIRVDAERADQPLHVIVGIHRSADDLQCFAVGTHADGLPPLVGRTEYDFTVQLRDVPLLRGDYSIIAFVGDEHAITVFDRRDLRPAFSMTGDRFEIGLLAVDHRWQLDEVEAPVLERRR